MYLYSARLKGLQAYIFNTEKMKEIIGASALIEEMCTQSFKEFIDEGEDEIILSAAGKIDLIIKSKDRAQKLILELPKKVAKQAPGIQFTQAMVQYDGDWKKSDEELRSKLAQAQLQNDYDLPFSLMGAQRSPLSGNPAVELVKNNGKEELLDTIQKAKRDFKVKENENLLNKLTGDINISLNHLTNEVERITESTIKGKENWLAIVHIDGNSLGKVVGNISKSGQSHEKLKSFSTKLDKCTVASAQSGFKYIRENFKPQDEQDPYPIIPIVIGGDDFTAIMRADFAVPFTKVFLESFERLTEEELKEYLPSEMKKLTACAGIAYIKPKFPFYPASMLAEDLCNHAKKVSKKQAEMDNTTPYSNLHFHKVQSSFSYDYEGEIIPKESTFINDSMDNNEFSLKFGPYFLDQHLNQPSIDTLLTQTKVLIHEKSYTPISKIRKWLSDASNNEPNTLENYQRMIQVMKENKMDSVLVKLDIKEKPNNKTHLYDLLTLSNFHVND